MGKFSKIEWTHHTFNPWWGCVKVSPACRHCYAETWAKRVGSNVWGRKAPRRFFSDKHWDEPIKWNKEAKLHSERHRVFCASMGDVFERRADLNPHRARLWSLIENTPWLDWLLLTKRPQNIRTYMPWQNVPDNIWLGITAETQRFFDERIDDLLAVKTKVHFLSCEPLLGFIDISKHIKYGIDWVIAGGESGCNSRPMNPDWAKNLRDQCVQANIPFHFKQWGHWAPNDTPNMQKNVKQVTFDDNQVIMYGVGKNAAGRYLDGEEWNQLPGSV